jgi:predicted DsbA family dithiol-disulfide isomerase
LTGRRAGYRKAMAQLTIREFTDPACPFAFSAEPARLRLDWLYGDQLVRRLHMVGLSERPEDYLEKGFTPELLAEGLGRIQRLYGMPIDRRPRPRMIATIVACRAVVATRLNAPQSERPLLRRLMVRGMAGELIDEPDVIAAAANDAGIEGRELRRWMMEPETQAVLRADMASARAPSQAARALRHKLAPHATGWRYTCPSLEIEAEDGRRIDLPGFQPVEAYEVGIANLEPELARRADPGSVEEVLEWAREPLATAEVAAVCGIDMREARVELARTASHIPVGPDGYWSLVPVEQLVAA